MREWIGKHKAEAFGAAALAVIAAVCIIRMLQPVKVWEFGEDQLERMGEAIHFDADVIDENASGWYVDNSLEYGEVFVQTPAVDLPAGSYDVTIRYQGEGSGSTYEFTSTADTYRVMLGRNGMPLESGKRGKTLESYYFRPVEGFSIKIKYGGEGYLILNEIEIHQTRALERMVLFSILTVAAIWAFWRKVEKQTNIRSIFLWGIGIGLVATIPLMMPYLHEAVDLPFHLMRIEGIKEGVRDGQIPVRIQPNWMNGYGYPVSVFYGEGTLWIAGILRLIGFPLQLSFKLYVAILNAATFWIASFCFRRIFKEDRIAVFGGILYTLAPYRLSNLYIRGAIGECIAQTFLPLILVGVYEILMIDLAERRKSGWMMLAAGMTGIIQSHMLTCEVTVIMLIVTCAICFKRTFQKERFLDFLKAVGATALVNCFFLIPFLDYMRDEWNVNSRDFGMEIQTTGAFLNQLLVMFPNGVEENYSIVEGLTEGREISFAIGIAFVLGAVLFLINWKRYQEGGKAELKLGTYCFWAGLLLAFMSTVWFPWDFLYESSDILKILISHLQFPRRVLGTAALMLTVVTCLVLKEYGKQENGKYFEVLLTVMLVFTGITTLYSFDSMAEESDYIYVADMESLNSFDVGRGEYMPAGTAAAWESMPEGRILKNEAVKITDYRKQGTKISFVCTNTSSEEQAVELPLLYYRGYEAWDSDTKGIIAIDGEGDNGKLRVRLAGNYSGTIQVKFQEPVLWRVSEIVSLISSIWLAVCFLGKRTRAYDLKKKLQNGGKRWIR